MSSELRQDVRKRTFLHGRIIFNNNQSTMDCLIRDMSESGARLELSETSTLPEVFDLLIPARDMNLRSTLAWRRGGEVGVNFVTTKQQAGVATPVADPTTVGLLRRIADLEAENAALRAVLLKPQQPTAA